jgi:hypothetical protein
MEWKETRKFESGLQLWQHGEADSKDIEVHTFGMITGWTINMDGGQVPFNPTLESALNLAESFIISRREIAQAKEDARILSEARKEARNARRRKKPAQN